MAKYEKAIEDGQVKRTIRFAKGDPVLSAALIALSAAMGYSFRKFRNK